MIENKNLETYWITFPSDPNLPMGIGVTAFSVTDAFHLIEEQGIADWFKDAQSVHVRKGIRIDEIDASHIRANMGPMQFRGVWYPAMNLGFGASKDVAYKKLTHDN